MAVWQQEGTTAEVKEKENLYLVQWLETQEKGKKNCVGSKYNAFEWIGYWEMKTVVLI